MMMILVCHVESCQLGYSQTIHSSKELSVYKTSASPTHCVRKLLDLIRTLPRSWSHGASYNKQVEVPTLHLILVPIAWFYLNPTTQLGTACLTASRWNDGA